MKAVILAAVLASLAFAGVPSNAIYLTNNTGSTVNQPYIISRFFAQGEIRNYPKPSGLSQWQAEVKTRWPDGSVQHALIAYWKSTPNTATDTIPFINDAKACHLGDPTTCTNAGLSTGGMLNFNGGSISAGQIGITNGGHVVLKAGAHVVVNVTTAFADLGAVIDMNDDTMLLTAGSVSLIRPELRRGYSGAAWTGSGIMSCVAAAAASSAHPRAL